MLCGEHTVCTYETSAGLWAGRLWCKRWSCPDCLPRRLRELRNLAAAGEPTTLITLTVRPGAFGCPDAAARRLVEAWRLVRQRAKREGLADRIQYIAIFESTKKGWPHLHILARCPFIPQKWLSDRLQEYADSPVVDIRKVYNRRHASRYVAKYVSKGPGRFDGCKRYWRSHGWNEGQADHRPVADANRAAWWTPSDVQSLAANLEAMGWVILEADGDSFTADRGRAKVWPWSGASPPEQNWKKPCLKEFRSPLALNTVSN